MSMQSLGKSINIKSMVIVGFASAAVCGATGSAGAGGRGGTDGILVPQAHAGQPLPGLTASELVRFQIGQTKFNTPLPVANGLGPVFNKNTCGNCHNNPLGGTGTQTVTRFGKDVKGSFDPLAEWGGSLLQASSITFECHEEIPAEADILQNRVTNGALAYGLVEAIPDAAILAVRDAQPIAVRGIAHMVGAFEDPPASPLRVGRFGWKAQVATVLTFSADASLNEMGLTNRFVMVENDPNGDTHPPTLGAPDFCDTVADPEDGPDGQGFDFIDRVTDFQRFLAPFPQTPKSGMSGEALFTNAIGSGGIGCAVCHTPTFTTSNSGALETALRNKVIRPYGDWLLHQMGTAGDPIVQGEGEQGMVKTPPLWGIATRDPIWHNGSVAGGTFENRMRAAIVLHQALGSQAKPSGDAFDALSGADQSKLLAFLGSLGQAEFDADQTNLVDLLDFQALRGCFTGPGSFYTPDSPCSIHDIDQDGDVDLNDFNSFMLVFQGPRRDCNNNGILDLKEILTGALADANNNGIADSCEPTCDTDINGSGNVNVADLLAIITGWGACPPLTDPCRADVTLDHMVNVSDLLAVINTWGNCK